MASVSPARHRLALTISGVTLRVPGPPSGDVPRQEVVAADPVRRRIGAARSAGGRTGGVAGNARLTATNAAVLLVLLAAEGVTVLRVRSLLSPHVFIGMLLVPPIVLKMASTGWRFVRYYLGTPSYRRKGPPPALLRLLGPFVVVLTVVLFASGIGLLYAPAGWQGRLLFLHKAGFVLWFGAMAIHVLGHALDTAKLAPRDWYRRTRRQVAGAGARQWGIAVSLVLGLSLGVLVTPHASWWLAHSSLTAGG